MGGRVEADPRLIEQAVRSVEGVAFAEVRTGEGEDLLRLVLWQGADAAECAYRIETELRDRFGIDLRPSDLRVVGYASPRGEPAVPEALPEEAPARPAPPELRVIELDGAGGTTWATEPILPGAQPPAAEPVPPESAEPIPSGTPEPGPAGPPPRGEPAAMPDTPTAAAATAARAPGAEAAILRAFEIQRVVVAESQEQVEVRVELRAGDRVYAGDAGGPPTASRTNRSLCHATLRAVAAALPGLRLDLDHVTLLDAPEPTALVVVTRLDAAGERRLAGAALVGRDSATAFVRATLAALRSA